MVWSDLLKSDVHRTMMMVGVGLLGAVFVVAPFLLWYAIDASGLLEIERWEVGLKTLAGLAVLLGFTLTGWRIHVSDKQAKAAEKRARVADLQVKAMVDGQVTERFTRAIELLGSSENGEPNLEMRLGGIFALERIARDSPEDHWTIMEVLTAYVRENTMPWPPRDGHEASPEYSEPPRVDVQAAMTVIERVPGSHIRLSEGPRLRSSFVAPEKTECANPSASARTRSCRAPIIARYSR